jgi:hypothetical protein
MDREKHNTLYIRFTSMTVLCLNLKEEVIASGKKEEEQK